MRDRLKDTARVLLVVKENFSLGAERDHTYWRFSDMQTRDYLVAEPTRQTKKFTPDTRLGRRRKIKNNKKKVPVSLVIFK